MADVLTTVLWWQLLLAVGWAISRRLRRLERSLRPHWYPQLGALRQQVVTLRGEQAHDTAELMRRAGDVEEAVAQLEDEVRELARTAEWSTRAVLDRIRRLERQLRPQEETGYMDRWS